MNRLAVLTMIIMTAGPVCAQTTIPSPQAEAPQAEAPKAEAPKAGAPGAEHPKTAHARVDKRIAQMKRQLKITPTQQSDWEAFAQVMRDNVATIDKAYKERAATLATMSAPDNLRNFGQIEQARAQGVQTLAASFQTLYDAMSDTQKKTADTMFRNHQERAKERRRAPQ